jgi:hypothetical protein
MYSDYPWAASWAVVHPQTLSLITNCLLCLKRSHVIPAGIVVDCQVGSQAELFEIDLSDDSEAVGQHDVNTVGSEVEILLNYKHPNAQPNAAAPSPASASAAHHAL